VARHADAIAEDGAAGVRARRIDADDADPLLARAEDLDEAIGEGALPCPGISGDADDEGGEYRCCS
jgi:hypothetical protein